MLEIQRYSVPSSPQWEMIIDGTRNPLNSWDKSDSRYSMGHMALGENDMNLMTKLAKAGPSHRKYLRMITVYIDITAPLYW